MAPHYHTVTEQNFVLDGEYISNGKVFAKGSYQIFSPHDDHGPFESKEGALILVIWDELKYYSIRTHKQLRIDFFYNFT